MVPTRCVSVRKRTGVQADILQLDFCQMHTHQTLVNEGFTSPSVAHHRPAVTHQLIAKGEYGVVFLHVWLLRVGVPQIVQKVITENEMKKYKRKSI